MRRRIVDRLRVVGRARRRETVLTEEHETFSADGTNSEVDGLDRRILRRLIAALPAGQHQAITLLKLEEKSLREASEITGQSVAALKLATHRGIKRLRTLITRDSDGQSSEF